MIERYKIRIATLEDMDGVCAMDDESAREIHDNYDEHMILHWAATTEGKEYYLDRIKKRCVLVAESNGEIVGFVAGEIGVGIDYTDIGKAAILQIIHVDETMRGKGAGAALVAAFVAEAKARGCSHVRIEFVNMQNKPAITFYEKNGFSAYEIVFQKKI
jgi:GNAT superfamily N-acetyltransferase